MLHVASWKYRTQKIRHMGTIAQLCPVISSQLRHVSTIGKKLAKQQYLLHMSSQYGELQLTNGLDPFGSLGHPGKFQQVRVLAALLHDTLVVGVSQSAALYRRLPPIFGRAAITLSIGPRYSCDVNPVFQFTNLSEVCAVLNSVHHLPLPLGIWLKDVINAPVYLNI